METEIFSTVDIRWWKNDIVLYKWLIYTFNNLVDGYRMK